MPRAKVIITDFVTEPLDDEQRTLGDLAEVTALDAHGEDELIGRIEDADALMVYHCIQLTPRVCSSMTRGSSQQALHEQIVSVRIRSLSPRRF